MTGQSYITVDGALSDSVVEYAAVLDFHNENLDFATKTQSFEEEVEDEDEDDEIIYKDGLYEEVAESYKYLTTIPDKEFESVVNLAIYILTFSKDFDSLLKKFLVNLIQVFEFNDSSVKIVRNKRKSLKITSIISILSNVFNLTDIVEYTTKVFIFDLILNLVAILDNSEILVPITNQVESLLLNESSTPSEETRAVIIKLAKLIKPTDESKSLKLYELAITKIPTPSTSIIEEYLIESLNSKKSIDLTSIVSLSTTSFEIPSLYTSLIKDYLSLPSLEFQSKISSYNQLKSLDFNQISLKNQYLTLAKLALNSNQIKYTEISSSLNIKPEDVERFIIDAIKLKVLEGKLSQSTQSLLVYKVNLIVKEIELKDWLEIKNNLLEWRSKLMDVKSLIEQSQKKKSIKA